MYCNVYSANLHFKHHLRGYLNPIPPIFEGGYPLTRGGVRSRCHEADAPPHSHSGGLFTVDRRRYCLYFCFLALYKSIRNSLCMI